MERVDTKSLGPLDRLEQALVYAHRVHAGQERKGAATPYIGHLLEVCGLVVAAGGDEDQQIAALLHDAAEDQGGHERLDEVRAQFGERVAAIVEACSDTLETPKPPWRARKEAHIAHLREADPAVLLVSLADKVSNVRALVADYRERGESLWARFNPDADQRWYYRRLADLFLERYPSRLATELDLAVADLERAMSAGPRRQRGASVAVLGIDLASARWSSVGSALLAFSLGEAASWTSLVAPAIDWPDEDALTPSALARAIDEFALANGVAAVSLDGPQAWRDPGRADAFVGRACERSARAPGRVGPYGVVRPAPMLGWVRFSIGVFAELLSRPHTALANDPGTLRLEPLERGYYVLECFPTSTWRASGLTPLPGAGRRPDTRPFFALLTGAFGLRADGSAPGHDDLQAIVAALPAAALLGGPARALPHGEPARLLDGAGAAARRVEGIIWDAQPA